MKVSSPVILLYTLASALSLADAFAPSPKDCSSGGGGGGGGASSSSSSVHRTQQHAATASSSLTVSSGNASDIERRAFGVQLCSIVAGGSVVLPGAAFALEYKPKYEDLRQIYGLGISLDNLSAKLADESKWRYALDGLSSFNKDTSFYPGYARNYVGKIVKANADADRRNGYIKEATALISSCQGLLEGTEEGLAGKDAGNEAMKRVKEAQALIAKFLSESGVEDERIAAFVAAHL